MRPAAMIAALNSHGAAIPRYLEILHAELSAQGMVETALLSMFCFWHERVASMSRFRTDDNCKYYLSRTPYRFLPMTESQKVLVNIAAYRGEDPQELLSPRQQAAFEYIHGHADESWPDVIVSDDFRSDWERVREWIRG